MASHARDGVPVPWSHRTARALDAVPDVFLYAVALSTAVGVIGAWTGVSPFASPAAARVVLMVLAVVAIATLVMAGSAGRRPPTDGGFVHTVPALALVAYAIGVRFLPAGARAEWFLGGDHVRHLLFVADERATGTLDYATQPYPRAWHTFVTTIWTATGGDLDGPGLRSLVDLMSTLVWLLPAVLSLVTGSVTVALAKRCGLGERPSGAAGLTAAAAVLLSPFLANYQALGFENSYVGAIVLAVAVREVVVEETTGWASRVLVAVAALVVCAHSWQLLIPGVGLGYLWVAWPIVRRGTTVQRAFLVVVSACGAALTVPALTAVVTVIGVQHAADSQVVAPVPVPFLVLGVAAALVVALLNLRGRRDPAQLLLVGIVLIPMLTAAWLVVRVGISVTDYYPSKLLWHSAVLGLAPLAVLLVRAWSAAGQPGASRVAFLVRRAVVPLSALVVAYALLSPAGAFVGAWSTTRGPMVLDAITSPRAGDAQVVWLSDMGDDTIARLLLDFYRVPDPTRSPQTPLDVSGECALLEAADRPAVLTDRSAAEVAQRYSCAAGTQAVPVVRR